MYIYIYVVLKRMSDSDEYSDELIIHKNTKYWIYVITSDMWTQLSDMFSKNKNMLSSMYSDKIMKGDIILIYEQHSQAKNGFVAICQSSTTSKNNTEQIKIFNDKNMNKYCIDLSFVSEFDQCYKLTQLEKQIKEKQPTFKTATFKKSYVNTVPKAKFINIDNIIGKILIENLIKLHDNNNKKESDIELISDEESCSDNDSDNVSDDDSDNDSEDESDDDLDDGGNIPILLDPCVEFKWDKNKINNFKKHYVFCNRCKKIDNNEKAFSFSLESSKIICEELTDIDDIDMYLEYYHELKNYKMDDDKVNTIKIFRINSRGTTYHTCILIVW
jgi:hypothetical protein